MSNSAYIQHINYYLPHEVLSNDDIAQEHPEWSVDKIAEKTGILLRHIAAKDETALDMACKVAELLIEEHKINKESIDFVLLCTQSPDYFLPTGACILQDRLGLSNSCGALDFNLGCSGYVYGLGLAKGLIGSGQSNNVLLITSETYSKYINPQDKGNKTIFGDGASATLISKQRQEIGLNAQIGQFCYGTDGSGYRNLIVENGAARHPVYDGCDTVDENGVFKNGNNLYMDGKAIFNFTATSVPKLVRTTMEKNETSLEGIHLAIFHQANAYMMNFVRVRCGIDKDKFYVNLSDGGNTVSSTIPIAMARAIVERRIAKNSSVLLCGFGVGLSMGAVVIKCV